MKEREIDLKNSKTETNDLTYKKVEFQENREENEPEEIFEKITTMNFPKLIERIYREVEGYSRPEKHCEP